TDHHEHEATGNEKSYYDTQGSLDCLEDDCLDQLQPNQRRAIDSQDLSQDSLASTNLGLEYSDPMLAITQLPNAGRSSIALSIHSNMTTSSSQRRQCLQQLRYSTEEKRESLQSAYAATATTNADATTPTTERNLEAYILPDLTDFDDGNPPMDTHWYGYVIVACSFLIYFIVFGTEHTFGVYQEYYTSSQAEPFLQNTTNQDVTMIGTLATTFTYLLGPFSGRFADRSGYRVSTVLGAVIMGAGLGGLVLGPVTEHLIANVGVFWTLRIQGIFCLVGIGGSGMMLKTRVKKVVGQNKRAPMDLTICKEIPFLTLTVANFLTSLGYMIPFFFLSTFAVFHGQTPKTGALMIGILNGASLVGRLSLGFVTDRVGRINMLFLCALVSGLSILCIWSVATSLQILAVFAVIYGFTCGGYFSVIPSVIAEIYGLDRLTTVTGLLYGSIGLGYLIGSPVSGLLLDITKPNTNYIYVVIFSGGSMTLSSFALFYLKYWRTNGRWWSHG
ncbi:hypothetical protein BG011_001893, partial [Mortierella polycephala]